MSRTGTAYRIELPAGSLPFPGGLTVGHDGLHVSIHGGSPGAGQVVRVTGVR